AASVGKPFRAANAAGETNRPRHVRAARLSPSQAPAPGASVRRFFLRDTFTPRVNRAREDCMRIVKILAVVGVAIVGTQVLRAQPSVQGRWATLPYLMPINPVHIALMNNGKVLVVAGSGNVATETNFRATVWDPQAGTFTTQSVAWDMFCNGAVVLSDGRVLINGG